MSLACKLVKGMLKILAHVTRMVLKPILQFSLVPMLSIFIHQFPYLQASTALAHSYERMEVETATND